MLKFLAGFNHQLRELLAMVVIQQSLSLCSFPMELRQNASREYSFTLTRLKEVRKSQIYLLAMHLIFKN